MPTTRRVSRGRGPQRKMVWARNIVSTPIVAPVATGIQVNLLGQFEAEYGANLIGATVVRVRGAIFAAPAVAGPSACVFATRVSNDADATAGGGPIDSPYADWSMWEPFVFNDAGVADQTGDSDLLGRIVDVRSMRKLEEINEQFTAWVQPSNQAYNVSWNLSILLKLP